jgi:putative membrane protein
MLRLRATVSSIAILLTVSAWAQDAGNPAVKTPSTRQTAPGAPAPPQLNQADLLFIREAAIGGMAEVELAGLVEKRSRSEAVEGFARRMVEDHSKANDRLLALARQADIAPPEELDQEHKAMRDKLEKMSDAEFDQAYLQGQVLDHQKTVQLLEWEIGASQDASLKSFATETLPVVLRHLRMARDIEAQMTGKAP